MKRVPFLDVALKVLSERYSGAICGFVAGSIVRGENTEYSDIDLVVIFPKLPNAYRESFVKDGWPVEVFVHDSETLDYFFEEVDRRSGCPSLPQMVFEGIALPNGSVESIRLKDKARVLLSVGPPALSSEETRTRRYAITDGVDDLRAPRNREELIATLVRLYEPLADFVLRSRGLWSGHGKSVPRALRKYDEDFQREFTHAFDLAFSSGNTKLVIDLAEQILKPFGGFLFDGDRREAPAHWRSKIKLDDIC